MAGGWLRVILLGGTALALALAPVPAAARKVPVRAADHGGYGRVVFDWPREINYTVKLVDDRLVVTFAEPVDASFKVALDELSSWIASAEIGADQRSVAFVLKKPVAVKDGRSGNSIYLDVSEDRSAAPFRVTPTAAPAAAPAPTSAVPAVGTSASSPGTPSGTGPGPTAQGSPPPSPAKAEPSKAAPAEAPAKPVTSPSAKPVGDAAPAPAPAAPAPPSPAPSPPGPAPARETTAAAGPPTPAPAAAAALTPNAQPSAAVPGRDAPLSGPISPTLTFDPGQPAAAAVYVRNDQLYLVFDRPLAIGAGVVSANAGGLVGVIQPVLATGGSAFRLPMRPWLRPVVERSGTVWRVVFVPKVQPRRLELPVETQPDFALGGRLLVHAPDAPTVIELTDPEIGDRLMIVPLPAAIQAVAQVNRYPEVEFLPALQGIVIRPHGDGVAARLVREGVEVTAAGGLHLSPLADTALVRPNAEGDLNGTDAILSALTTDRREAERASPNLPGADYRLFDLKAWQRGGVAEYTKNRQKLQQAVGDSPPAERNKARLELARFYFAHGFNQEALGVLTVLAATQQDLQGWPEFKALRGAARVASGSPREGLEDLTGPGLDDNREAMLWRAAATVPIRQNLDRAAHDFYLADDILASYPDPYFPRLSMAAIEARIANHDPREAERLWKRLVRRGGANAERLPAAEYLRGLILRESGKLKDAIQHLKAAEQGGDRYYRAVAGLARTNLEFSEKRISAALAADQLSRLRFAWRGDELELDIIQRHGELQWEAGNYAEGLNTLREAAAYFPESPRASAITQSMTQMFGTLFADGASRLPALKAIELYDLFRELTPVGVAGDEVIRQLAERLVEVNLLGRAAELLEHQVGFRLTGVDKARVGARLASIRLIDSKPAEALKALETSGGTELPADLVEQRRVFRARALAGLHRSAEALQLLEGDTSAPADMMRVDIAWHDQRWDDAAAALEKLIGEPPEPGKPVDKITSQRVLNRAIALSLAGDSARLDALRASFGPGMDRTGEADAFKVLTRPEAAGGMVNLDTIKKRVAEVDIFQNFLKDYHKRIVPPS